MQELILRKIAMFRNVIMAEEIIETHAEANHPEWSAPLFIVRKYKGKRLDVIGSSR